MSAELLLAAEKELKDKAQMARDLEMVSEGHDQLPAVTLPPCQLRSLRPTSACVTCSCCANSIAQRVA